MSAAAPGRILLVDDDRVFRVSTAALLRQDGHEVAAVGDGREAVEMLRQKRFDLLLLDLRLPGTDGLGIVEALRLWGEGIPILMISGFGTVDAAVRALHLGADDFLTKPVEPDLLSARVAELLERRPDAGAVPGSSFGGMVGRSAAMREVFEAVRRVAPTETTVLVCGETGTGKELVARAIHTHSARANGPFVAVNCASLAEGLLESELFGHVKGAFTGAIAEKPGLFEAAAGGTLFLDEIGDVTSALQQRLLRALQEREIRRVGSVRATPVDVRIIAATRRDLREEVSAGRFREDLFYRLKVFQIELPPLRERSGDIPLLVELALGRLRSCPGGRERLTCSPFAMRMLRAYDWPGNVRELFAALESAAIRTDGDRIETQHLPPEVRAALNGGENGESRYRADAPEEERAAILAALEEAEGSRTRAAEILGMGRTTLWRKIKQYGIEPGPDAEP
ncbi:MAG: sigma-54-dependent Fis family transcriptional regulator [Gemmatimonadetes bacterium]|nr:sigma-54-dependent Fis family transcriptional regulator [Gemmatimonadota bacterium]